MAEKVEVNPGENKGKGLKIIIVILLVIILLIAGFVAFSFITKSFLFKETVNVPVVDAEIEETVVELGEFIVNIKTENNIKKYLKTSIAVGCLDKKDAERITEKMVQVRDLVIITLRSKSIDELAIGQEEAIKKDIVEHINTIFMPDINMNIYFTDYIIQ